MTVSVKGAELFTVTRGRGPICLFLCGMGTRPNELLTPPPLSDCFKLVYVDLRGSGRSTGEASDLTFDVLADDLEAVRADLGGEKIAVLGHSILGVLAIEYGRRRPAGVSHVIAVGTPPFGDMTRLSALASAFFEADASEERKRLLWDNLAQLPSPASFLQTMSAQTPTRFFDPCFEAAPLFAEASFRSALLMHVMRTLTPAWDINADPGSLRVPIFLAHGRYDYAVPCTLWDGLAGKLPDATFRIFEKSGHQPFFEEPDLFALTLTEWMAGRLK